MRLISVTCLVWMVTVACVEAPLSPEGFRCDSDLDCAAGPLKCLGGICSRTRSIDADSGGQNSTQEDGGGEDGGASTSDAGIPEVDAGADGGRLVTDAGKPAFDAGAPTPPRTLRLFAFRADYPFPFTAFPPWELPTRGSYMSEPTLVQRQLKEIEYGGGSGVVLSWYGKGTVSDTRAHVVIDAGSGTMQWALFYEKEEFESPDAAATATIINNARVDFAQRYPQYLHLDGGFVLFVAKNDAEDVCDMAERWVTGNRATGSTSFLILTAPSAGPAVSTCLFQPNAWRVEPPRYLATTDLVATVAPGLWRWNDNSKTLVRNRAAFELALSNANDGGRRLQFISSYNLWAEGSAVESGHQRDGGGSWASDSGYGAFLDLLHAAPPSFVK